MPVLAPPPSSAQATSSTASGRRRRGRPDAVGGDGGGGGRRSSESDQSGGGTRVEGMGPAWPRTARAGFEEAESFLGARSYSRVRQRSPVPSPPSSSTRPAAAKLEVTSRLTCLTPILEPSAL